MLAGHLLPIGTRRDDGTIDTLHFQEHQGMITTTNGSEAQYAGRSEDVPVCIGQLVSAHLFQT